MTISNGFDLDIFIPFKEFKNRKIWKFYLKKYKNR